MKEFNAMELIEEIDNFSATQLKRKKDLSVLINICYSNNRKELIEDLSFTSKYVQGLFRVLKQSASNPEVQNTSLIKNDITGNLNKVKEKIEQILEGSDEQTKEYFRENYLHLSQTSLLNLTELMNDLEWTKKYLNYLKRENPN